MVIASERNQKATTRWSFVGIGYMKEKQGQPVGALSNIDWQEL